MTKTKISAALSCLLLLAACGGGGGDDDAPTSYTVQYQVTSVFATPVALTYQNSSGGVQQETVNTPFSKTFFFRQGDFLYFSAQNQSSTGTIKVSINTSGREIYTATTSAPFGIATASGSCCRE